MVISVQTPNSDHPMFRRSVQRCWKKIPRDALYIGDLNYSSYHTSSEHADSREWIYSCHHKERRTPWHGLRQQKLEKESSRPKKIVKLKMVIGAVSVASRCVLATVCQVAGTVLWRHAPAAIRLQSYRLVNLFQRRYPRSMAQHDCTAVFQ